MIGRDGPVKPFELAALEAHLLLVLATYCNVDAICWPTLRTLQADTRRGRRQVIVAMRRLEELQLVWSEQAGRGRAARRELLFNPTSADGLAVRPTAPLAVRPTALHSVNGQRNGQERQDLSAAVVVEGSTTNGQMMQCGQPHCIPPTPLSAPRGRRGPRPLAAILADAQRQPDGDQ